MFKILSSCALNELIFPFTASQVQTVRTAVTMYCNDRKGFESAVIAVKIKNNIQMFSVITSGC